MKQELHTDAPHGPWAFVLSLTPAERAFAGGETLIMKPHVLNYWPGFDPSAGLEMKHLVPACYLLQQANQSCRWTPYPACTSTSFLTGALSPLCTCMILASHPLCKAAALLASLLIACGPLCMWSLQWRDIRRDSICECASTTPSVPVTYGSQR